VWARLAAASTVTAAAAYGVLHVVDGVALPWCPNRRFAHSSTGLIALLL